MTTIIIITCLIIFLYIAFRKDGERTAAAIQLGAFYPSAIREHKQYWRIIACHFIHIDAIHFIMNAYALYNLGIFMETLMGEIPYLYLIFTSMIFGCLMTLTMAEINSQHNYTITLGASCIVYGFFGAIVALGLINANFVSLLESFAPVIVINFAYTFMNIHVSKTGHLGGFIGGMLATVVMAFVGII